MTVNRENLAKLATYLEALPEGYEYFHMDYFSATDDEQHTREFAPQEIPSCGTVACAVGHGPQAGIPVPKGIYTWWRYMENAFGVEECSAEGQYLFSSSWSTIDNTPQGAAKRIRTYLASGIPDFGKWYD